MSRAWLLSFYDFHNFPRWYFSYRATYWPTCVEPLQILLGKSLWLSVRKFEFYPTYVPAWERFKSSQPQIKEQKVRSVKKQAMTLNDMILNLWKHIYQLMEFIIVIWQLEISSSTMIFVQKFQISVLQWKSQGEQVIFA